MSEETLNYLSDHNITVFIEISSNERERPGGFQDEIKEDELIYEKDGEYFKLKLIHTLTLFKPPSTSIDETKITQQEYSQIASTYIKGASHSESNPG